MSTLKKEDYAILTAQIEASKGQLISKEEVLLILHEKVREIDAKNMWIVDQFDGEFIKGLTNSISNIKPHKAQEEQA